MNPQNQQPQNSLDPSVVALTKAIGQNESGGNYNVPQGKNGEIGAYQMTPAFIQQYAPRHLKDYNPQVPLNPAQQDELAYNVVKDWGTKEKLTPAQVASKWNSGDPNAYLDEEMVGTNRQGAKYDVPGYVNKIQQNYEKNVPSTTAPQDVQSDPSFLESFWKDFTGGIEQGASLAGGVLGSLVENPAVKVGLPIAATVAGGPIAGTVVGAGLSAIGGKTQSPQQSTPSPTSVQQPNILQDIQSLQSELPQAQKASSDLSGVYQKALERTVSDRRALADPNLQAGIQANAKYGFAPNVDENGVMDFTEARKKSGSIVSDLSEKIASVLDKEDIRVPIQETISRAKQSVRERTPSNEWDEADRHIDSIAGSYAKNFGGQDGSLSLGSFERMRKEMGPGAKFDKTASNARLAANKAMYFGARQTITENTKNPELYDAVMKEEQNLINGQKIMKRLDFKKSPKESHPVKEALLSAAGRYATIYIGDKIGGPIGAVLSSLVGAHISKAIDKKFGKTMFETPEMRSALDILHDTEPRVYKRLLLELDRAGVEIQPKEITNPKGKSVEELLKKKSVNTPIEKLDVLVNEFQQKNSIPSPSNKSKPRQGLSGLVRAKKVR